MEERYADIFDAMPDAVLVINREGAIVHVNTKSLSLFGYERHELLGKSIELLVPVNARAQHPAKRDQFFRNPSIRPMASGLCLFACHKDGHEIDVEISLSPLQSPEGTLVMACVRDIRDRKQLEDQLRQAQKLGSV